MSICWTYHCILPMRHLQHLNTLLVKGMFRYCALGTEYSARRDRSNFGGALNWWKISKQRIYGCHRSFALSMHCCFIRSGVRWKEMNNSATCEDCGAIPSISFVYPRRWIG